LKIKTKIVSCHTADSKQVKQEVNSTVILPPLVFPGGTLSSYCTDQGFKSCHWGEVMLTKVIKLLSSKMKNVFVEKRPYFLLQIITVINIYEKKQTFI
jgi:hypothetical protein